MSPRRRARCGRDRRRRPAARARARGGGRPRRGPRTAARRAPARLGRCRGTGRGERARAALRRRRRRRRRSGERCARPSARLALRPSASRSGSARRSSRSSSSAGRATRRRSRCACAYAWARRARSPRRAAGIGFAQPTAAEGFRLADVRGLDAAGAVVAAALAQLGWPYVWGGESRAEGGFDCSGLVDYALAAAGLPVGRLDAAGLQRLARRLPAGAGLLPGDLVFAGDAGAPRRPRGGPGTRRRGAAPRCARARRGARRRRLDGRRADPAAGGGRARPRRRARRARLRAGAAASDRCARCARRAAAPALLAAQLEAESGFDAAAVSPAGAQGIAQFMPARGPAPGTRSARAARSSPGRRSPRRRA